MKNYRLLLISALVLLIASCAKEKYMFDSSKNNCDVTNLSYVNGISDIINNNCAYEGCHAGRSDNFDYTTYNGIKTAVGGMKNRINRSTDDPLFMPQLNQFNTPLSTCDLEKLNAWIDNGAPLK